MDGAGGSRWVRRWCWGLLILAAGFLLARSAARWFWGFDNLTALLVPAGCGLALLFLLSLLSRDRLVIGLAVAVLMWGWYPVFAGGLRRAEPAGAELRILAMNVKTANRDFARACDAIARSGADVVVVMEVDEDWERALDGLEERFPYRICEPRFDNFGIALLSRTPLIEAATLEPGHCTPMIRAVIESDGRAVTVLGVHPLPPMGAELFHARNVQLSKIAALARKEGNPVVVAGDLNVAPWSPYFRWLLEDGGLRDTRSMWDLWGSYPTQWPVGRARIDHVLISAQLGVADSGVGEDIGSDHLPVWATVGFRRQ